MKLATPTKKPPPGGFFYGSKDIIVPKVLKKRREPKLDPVVEALRLERFGSLLPNLGTGNSARTPMSRAIL